MCHKEFNELKKTISKLRKDIAKLHMENPNLISSAKAIINRQNAEASEIYSKHGFDPFLQIKFELLQSGCYSNMASIEDDNIIDVYRVYLFVLWQQKCQLEIEICYAKKNKRQERKLK